MNLRQRHALLLRETDISGAMRRFGGDEKLYVTCLKKFLEDPTMERLNEAVGQMKWDDAFTAAHALKGLAGNMGFIPLMHSIGQLVVLIRGGRTREIDLSMTYVNSKYRDITDGINDFFLLDDGDNEIL